MPLQDLLCINGIVQSCGISNVLAVRIPQSYTKSPILPTHPTPLPSLSFYINTCLVWELILTQNEHQQHWSVSQKIFSETFMKPLDSPYYVKSWWPSIKKIKAFYVWKSFEITILFLLSPHWCRKWLGTKEITSHKLNQWWLIESIVWPNLASMNQSFQYLLFSKAYG